MENARTIIDNLLEYAVKFAEQEDEPNNGGCWDAIEQARTYLSESGRKLEGAEGDIAELMAERIDSGDLELGDIPARLAQYGLMDPVEFAAEMRERMDNSNGLKM